jgi:hypothetical protein
MKILFTGMASSHCSPIDNVSFFSTVAKAVETSSEVVWATPKISWTKDELDSFDLIFFGFIPPTALSANKIYGAMHVLGLMFDSPKLRLIVDGHQIWQYKNSIEMVKRDISSLFSSFYSKRAEYSSAKDPSNRGYINLASKYFSSEVWPITYYPKLPWTSHEKAVASLGFGTKERFVGVSLDSILINPEPYSMSTRGDFWSVDNHKSVWLKKLEPSIRRPVYPLKPGRLLTDQEAITSMRESLGLIIAPQDRGVGSWWSYRYIQALNSNTPVATNWIDAAGYSESWSHLAYQIEDMDYSQRLLVAKNQLESYQASLQNKKQTIDTFMAGILDLSSERI